MREVSPPETKMKVTQLPHLLPPFAGAFRASPRRSRSSSGTTLSTGSSLRLGTSAGRLSAGGDPSANAFNAALIPQQSTAQQLVPRLSLPSASRWEWGMSCCGGATALPGPAASVWAGLADVIQIKMSEVWRLALCCRVALINSSSSKPWLLPHSCSATAEDIWQ